MASFLRVRRDHKSGFTISSIRACVLCYPVCWSIELGCVLELATSILSVPRRCFVLFTASRSTLQTCPRTRDQIDFCIRTHCFSPVILSGISLPVVMKYSIYGRNNATNHQMSGIGAVFAYRNGTCLLSAFNRRRGTQSVGEMGSDTKNFRWRGVSNASGVCEAPRWSMQLVWHLLELPESFRIQEIDFLV